MSAILFLTGGGITVVDHTDYSKASKYRWCCARRRRKLYVTARIEGKKVYLHRWLLKPKRGVYVDHRNGCGLDNRRANLRLCTNAENNRARRLKKRRATSVYRGVSFEAQTGRWKAQITVDGCNLNLGRYRSEQTAAMVYNNAAKQHFGEFTHLNPL